MEYTENLRNELPIIFTDYDIKTVLDAPCGDFNWMQHVLKETPKLNYIGGDIVKELIVDNNSKYKSKNISFLHLDITRDSLPDADLMIVRDCLFHLSFMDIQRFLENLAKSNIKYLLTSTYMVNSEVFKNTDILSGDFRLIDIFSEPFCFPSSPLRRIEDYILPEPPREMCLFDVKSLLSHRENCAYNGSVLSDALN